MDSQQDQHDMPPAVGRDGPSQPPSQRYDAAPLENTSGQHGPVPEEIARGWNWGAFLLAPVWALGHQVWALAFLGAAPFALAVTLCAPYWGATVSRWGAMITALAFAVSLGPQVALLGLLLSAIAGAVGNRLAWQHRRFESIEHFRHVQFLWARWGVVLLLLVGLLSLYAGARLLMRPGPGIWAVIPKVPRP